MSPKIRHQNDVTKMFHFQAHLGKILVALLVYSTGRHLICNPSILRCEKLWQ